MNSLKADFTMPDTAHPTRTKLLDAALKVIRAKGY
ncbi:MAG: hypothetical protein RL341_1377, partial [Pseudomonadota bacterium]